MKTRKILMFSLVFFYALSGMAQEKYNWDFERKHYVGNQLFMILTPLLDPS